MIVIMMERVVEKKVENDNFNNYYGGSVGEGEAWVSSSR